MPITIYTMDGTGSPSATLPNGPGNKGGGFPASLAMNLVAADPVTWQWFPVDYKPGFGITKDVPIMKLAGNTDPTRGSANRAFNIVSAQILSSDNYFVLSGLSQGAWISDFLYEELRNPAGSLHSKYPYLLGVITFGSPRRPHGHTLTDHLLSASGFSTSDIIDPSGRGACGAATYTTPTFGSVPGIMTSPPSNGEVQWFCNLNDAASDSATMLDNNVADVVEAVAHFMWEGAASSGLSLITQLTQFALTAGLNPTEFHNFIDVMQQWSPFAGFVPIVGKLAPDENPHAMYADPHPYTALSGNTLSAVTLATNYLLKLGAQYATGPATPIPKDSYSWWQTPPD